MHHFSFAGRGPKPMPPKWVEYLFAYGLWVFGVMTVSVLLGLIFHHAAFGACTTIPVTPADARRDAVCERLGREANCFMSPRSLTAGQLFLTETDFELFVAGKSVGTFEFEEGIPATPGQCEDRQYVDGLLRFHTGGATVQNAVHAAFPEVGANEVIYFDRLIGAYAGDGTCVLTAELLVVK
jgi:hypothetical protein